MKCYFNIHNVKICIEGEGGLYDYFLFQYRQFQVESIEDSLLVIELNIVKTIAPLISAKEPKEHLSNGISFFSIEDGFVWEVKKQAIIFPAFFLTANKNLLIANGDFPKMHFNTIFDFLLRIYFIRKGYVLVHAACVSLNNKGVLLPAWKSVGKTELALKLVESGFSFLGDDKVWLNKENKVLSYPRYVVIKESNAESFVDVTGKMYLFKKKIKSKLLLDERNGKIFMFYNAVISKLIKLPVFHLPIEKLYPNSKTIKSVKLSSVFYLTKHEKTTVKQMSRESLQTSMKSINNLEWNSYLFDFVNSHDLICSKANSWSNLLLELIKSEEEIIEESIDLEKTYELNLQENRIWNTIVDIVINKI